jgi:hypothetical protein
MHPNAQVINELVSALSRPSIPSAVSFLVQQPGERWDPTATSMC